MMSNDIYKIKLSSAIQVDKQKQEMHPDGSVIADSILTSTEKFQFTENKEQNNKEILQNLNEHGFIFGSTSPRGMSTSTGTVGSNGINCIHKKDFEKNISSCSTLDIHNKVENLTISDVHNQLKELQQNLLKSENVRDDYKRRLEEATKDKERCYRQLEIISASNESRITEMHCVIAELSKKLRNKQDNIILEENELEGSEISYQEGSIYKSELNLTNPDAECQTEPFENDFNNSFVDDIREEFKNETLAKTQIEVLQEEVFHLKAQIALLESQLASNNEESTPEAQQDESKDDGSKGNHNNGNYKDVKKLNCCYNNYKTDDNEKIHTKELILNSSEMIAVCLNSSAIKQSTTKYLSNQNIIMSQDNYQRQIKNSTSDAPVPKMAERVKLRRTTEEQNLTGSNLLNTGIQKTELVEHLVSGMVPSNNMFDDFIEPSLHIEFQRLQRRVEHLKIRNSVLSLTLDEVKEHCDHLYLLCGKYESNAVALQCALNCSDRAIEAYDVMLALLESKLAILKEKSLSAEESRNAVETVARHLLDKLESEKNISENSLGPWQNTFCITESQPSVPWTTDDDCRLRNHVSKLKGRRSTVQNTIVNLESPFSTHYDQAREAFESNKEAKLDNSQMDLEMAVLMQELLSLREDLMEAKQNRDEAEKEKKIAMDKIFLLQDTLQKLQNQLTDSEALLNLTSRDRSSFSEADHAALIERQLVEALTRESELKNRIQSLIGSMSISKKYDEKYIQVQKSKIKRLEQKITEMRMQNTSANVPETTL